MASYYYQALRFASRAKTQEDAIAAVDYCKSYLDKHELNALLMEPGIPRSVFSGIMQYFAETGF